MPRSGCSNLAFFSTQQKSLFAGFAKAQQTFVGAERIFVIAANDKAIAAVGRLAKRLNSSVVVEGKSFSELAFLRVPISFREVASRIDGWMASASGEGASPAILAVDMSWGLETNSAAANFESWTAVAEDLASRSKIAVASLYNRRVLIDEQLLAALRGHPLVLTGSGIVENPHWLPANLLVRGTLREQVDYWLGTVSPELGLDPLPAAPHAAEGADPMWLLRRAADESRSISIVG